MEGGHTVCPAASVFCCLPCCELMGESELVNGEVVTRAR